MVSRSVLPCSVLFRAVNFGGFVKFASSSSSLKLIKPLRIFSFHNLLKRSLSHRSCCDKTHDYVESSMQICMHVQVLNNSQYAVVAQNCAIPSRIRTEKQKIRLLHE